MLSSTKSFRRMWSIRCSFPSTVWGKTPLCSVSFCRTKGRDGIGRMQQQVPTQNQLSTEPSEISQRWHLKYCVQINDHSQPAPTATLCHDRFLVLGLRQAAITATMSIGGKYLPIAQIPYFHLSSCIFLLVLLQVLPINQGPRQFVLKFPPQSG